MTLTIVPHTGTVALAEESRLMLAVRRVAPLLFVLLLAIAAQSLAAVAPLPPLAAPPCGERWFTISLNGQKTGFGYLKIEAVPDGYEVTSVGSVKMEGLLFSRDAWSRERYRVNRDLSLRSFVVEEVVNGHPLRLAGKVAGKTVTVAMETPEGNKEKLLKVKGAVYPPPVLNCYPLMQGITPGRRYRLHMLDVEEVKIRQVTFTAVGRELLPGGIDTVHLRNDLFPVDNDVWVDVAGNTVRESVRDDMILTRAEEAKDAALFIADAALEKKGMILDFSRIRVDPPVSRPGDVTEMVVELCGLPGNVPLLEGAGQVAVRLDGNMVRISTSNRRPSPEAGAAALADAGRYLGSSEQIPAHEPEIIARKNEILGAEHEPLRIVEKLAHWVALQVKENGAAGKAPLAALKTHAGNSRAPVLLYAALARAAGIPTRIVTGLVYAEGEGFLYQSWAESHAGGWLTVDPASGEVPADATHLKLTEGDGPGDLVPLAGIIGRIQARVVEVKYRDQRPGTGNSEKRNTGG